ncbi:Ferredoxin-dependent glutamate synthase 1 [Anaerohalosphaera lusitana]|uniref:Glutamate synthase [NADPH] large chain n=1 Tax=Anaerohalosphaera lusitana TaxID=1936003 RepID=A0A1U9NN34_9BACT|nr:glutamate synthase large subunit [Anaerohalosphaera lusitana]AQT69245.1 Ferredoxin-dependent glutamate synthase 1 [Anaerohalosphaera lusitana]
MQQPHDQGLYRAENEHDACGIGAVANISGKKSHSIIEYGKEILENLHHRGAAGADEVTGDGAGILSQIPHKLFSAEAKKGGFELPNPGEYGVGMVFEPKDKASANECEKILEASVIRYGLKVLGWRDVPFDNSCLAELALVAEPKIRQVFVDGAGTEPEELERKFYMARKRTHRLVREQLGDDGQDFYICSMSARTICYKGMFMAWQLFTYYPDLADKRFESALAIVHQRYSTNTFPNWKLAQPFRMIAHNGEINTLSGNRNCAKARESRMRSDLFGDDLDDLRPILSESGSDSACFDNMLELLVRGGRSMPHSMMMMVPEAFGSEYHISRDKRAFYEYHAALMEPWDGPAAMLFTDGKFLGGTLDRNGLRPSRYLVTTDGLAVVASETGVVNFPTERIQQKGRLRPGKMFLIDTEQGRIVTDNEIKSKIARQKPYRRWLDENRIELRGLFDTPSLVDCDEQTLRERLRIFGYTREELSKIITPMAANGQEPIGSMGNDAPLAVLSDKPNLLFNYFKQRFAQVTNPPIDPLREGLVMSLMMFTGKRRNILEETPEHCHQLKLPHPILTNDDLNRLRNAHLKDFKTATVDAIFDANAENPEQSLRQGLEYLVDSAAKAVEEGACIVIISDVNASEQMAPIPSLLATSAVHHGLLKRGLRGDAGVFVETGEAREVMHFCLLTGYGANAVNPYAVFQTIHNLYKQGEFGEDIDPVNLANNYITAVKKGILKTMSKMGISTLRSYHMAQLFEAIGLNKGFLDEYFVGTSSTIEGVGLAQIAEETVKRHKKAFTKPEPGQLDIEFGGDYTYRRDGEHHLWNPTSVARLQHAVRFDDKKAYEEFAEEVNDQSRKLSTLRGLFELKTGDPIPLEEVEPASEIVKRFCTGAMSHGSISKEAHECMAIAMNRIGGMSNTGEGGEDPARYELDANGDDRNCAIKQIASGRFGVTINYLAHAKEIQIKMAQGAKPGEGGQLPGKKVTEEIAKMRFSTPGVTLISPPPHHDIYSIEDLAQLIYDLKCSNPGVKVSVKLVSEVGVGTVAAGVAKGNADEVLISGHDGGTGASPLSSIKHAGCPWEIGLAEAQQVLVINGLRDRIRVQVDGQMKTGRDVVIGALLGAEQFGFGTSVLVTMGCTLLRKCHEGTCTFGIATQNPDLRKRFAGTADCIVRYMHFVAEEVRSLMAQMGFREFDDMVGQVEKLRVKDAVDHYKAKGLDFSKVFYQPDVSDGRAIRRTTDQIVKIDDHIDWKIIEQAEDAIENKKKTTIELPIRNIDRTVGAILSNRIVKKHGPAGLPDDTLQIVCSGSAGQSFGAYLINGVTLKLLGDCNDYLGKSLSGGRIIVETPESPYLAHENIAAGNTILYGATTGEVFINGMAGERFAVRNSGATSVVEGVGDHGCEYMTGGTVVVLGQTGRNFAAGMSGGIAYVFDDMQLFDTLCNLDMVELETVWREEDKKVLRELIERHSVLTNSTRAQRILRGWVDMVGKFVKVIPIDYRKALEKMRANEQRDTEMTPATEEVFNG